MWTRCNAKLRRHLPPDWVWSYVDMIVDALQPLFFLIKKLQRHANSYLLSDAIAAVAKTASAYNTSLAALLEEVSQTQSCQGVRLSAST